MRPNHPRTISRATAAKGAFILISKHKPRGQSALWRAGNVKYLIPFSLTVACMALIFYLSSTSEIGFGFSNPPDEGVTPHRIDLQSTLAHFFMYAILSGLVMSAAWPRRPSLASGWKWPLFVVLFATLYGVMNEINQLYVDGRSASLGDGLLNLFGATAAVLVVRWVVMPILFRTSIYRSKVAS